MEGLLPEVVEFPEVVFIFFFWRNRNSRLNKAKNKFVFLSGMNFKTARAYRMKEAIHII
jgi:hypothetical protein